MDSIKSAKRDLDRVLSVFTVIKFLLLAVSFLLGPILIAVLTSVYGENADDALQAFLGLDTWSGLLLEAAVFLFAVGLPICVYFAFGKRRFREVVYTEKPQKFQVFYGAGLCFVVGQIASVIGNLLLTLFFSYFGMEDAYYAMLEDSTAYPTSLKLVPLFALVIAVFPALMEETAFRGAGLFATKPYGTAFSILFSGIFFAFMHSSWTQIPFAFAVGMTLAYLTLKFRSYWVAVCAHFFFNFNSVVQCLILQNLGEYAEFISTLWQIQIFILALGLTVAGWIVYGVKIPKTEAVPLKGHGWKAVFTSPWFYVFAALECLQLSVLVIEYSVYA